MQKQHGEKIESLKKEEKQKQDKITRAAKAITRTANEISAEAHKKLQVATGKLRSAMNLKSRAEAQEKVTTENQQAHEEMMQKLVDDLETEIRSLNQQLQEEMNRNSEEQEKEQNKIGTEQNKWGHDILQLVMELIVHGVPSGAINATIVSIIKILLKDDVDIEKLPSEWYVRRARSILLTVAELLAAYEVGKEENWGQLHTDMST
jgi:translation elongation factor EF-G